MRPRFIKPKNVVSIPVNSEAPKTTKAPAMDEIQSSSAEAAEIQGAIPFVRESRKAVIRDQLVNLQETVDDITATKSRQDSTREDGSARCLQKNLNEKFKSKELSIEVSVSNEKREESLPSQMQDLQIKASPDQDNNNYVVVEIFEQGSSETRQIVSGTGEWTMVDKDAVNLKRNKVENPVLEVDASPTIPCTEEWVMVGNSRDDVKSIEHIGTLREEKEKLKGTASDLLKKSEKQSEMIHDPSLPISQLEEHVSQCKKKQKIGDGKKKSNTSTEKRGTQAMIWRRKSDRHSSNRVIEDWYK